jgi:glycosyltransferase involved in cell wall biosynthesis
LTLVFSMPEPAGPRTVLVLPAWYPTARQPFNGPFVRDHARAAAAYGHRMVVLVDEGPSEKVRGLFTLGEEELDGDLRVVRLSWRPSAGRVAYLLGALVVARRLAREGTPVDVLHAHIHRMGWPAVLAGGVLRRPAVISENSSEWPRRLLTPAALRRARIAFPRAALVCPVSRHLRRSIESYGVRARFRVVANTVDVGVFHPSRHVPRRPPTRLINVALHVEVKGLDVLLRAFARLVERRGSLTLELIGEGPLTPDLRQLAAELGVAEHVRFAGTASPEQIAAALRAAHIFVLSSLSENMPLAVLEALCCGLPVVATDVGGVPEAVDAGAGALAPPRDSEALAGAIETVLDGYERFDRTGIALRAQARWSFDSVGGTWDEIYRSL